MENGKWKMINKIPEDWELTSVKNITVEHKQGFYTTDSYNTEGNVQLLRITDLLNPKIDYDKAPRLMVSEKEFEGFKVVKGDFLFGRSGDIGRYGICYEDRQVIFASYLIRFRFDQSKVLNEFFGDFYSSSVAMKQLEVITQGSSNQNINADNIKALLIPLPPIVEQKKIVVVLSAWDSAIEQTERLIVVKQKLKRGLMQQLLTGKKRFPAFQGQAWTEVHLGDVFRERCETYADYLRKMREQNLFEKNSNEEAGLELLAITARKGVVKRNSLEKRDTSNDDKSKYLRICPGDIGYNTMRMWQGVSGLSEFEGLISPAYTICTPTKAIDGKFASYLFKYVPVIHLFHRYSQGLVDDTLNLKFPNFAKIEVKIPPTIEEQKRIAEVLEMCDTEINFLKNKLEVLRDQKRGLMQLLLTGKLRVNSNGTNNFVLLPEAVVS